MKIISAKLSNVSYDISIKSGLLNIIGEQLRTWYQGHAITIVTDSNVDHLYGAVLSTSLSNAGYKVNKITIPPGESSKSLYSLNNIYNRLADAEIDRKSLIIAFGGGVVGDLTGFAAATYMRGISYIQIPTTVMSQLDSSIGGKTAVNLEAGKNLAGCFYHPRAVYIDPSLLETLPDRVYSDGLAEAVKYGAIKDSALFVSMLNASTLPIIKSNIESIIYNCCSIKNTLVQEDELDNGNRQLLNFGHTLGHGIEKYFDYKTFTHGEAVALGMLQITKNSEAMELTQKGSYEAVCELLNICKLPIKMPKMDDSKLLNIIAHDKKSKNDYVNLILLNRIGDAFIHRTLKTEVYNFIK